MIASEIQKLLPTPKVRLAFCYLVHSLYLNEVTYTDVDGNVYMVVSVPQPFLPIYRTASQYRPVHKTIVHDS